MAKEGMEIKKDKAPNNTIIIKEGIESRGALTEDMEDREDIEDVVVEELVEDMAEVMQICLTFEYHQKVQKMLRNAIFVMKQIIFGEIAQERISRKRQGSGL